MIALPVGKVIALTVLAKALIIMAATALLDIAFWKQVLIVAVSAVLSGAFGLIIAIVASRDSKATHRRLDALEARSEDVAGAVGAAKRRSDPTVTPAPPGGRVT